MLYHPLKTKPVAQEAYDSICRGDSIDDVKNQVVTLLHIGTAATILPLNRKRFIYIQCFLYSPKFGCSKSSELKAAMLQIIRAKGDPTLPPPDASAEDLESVSEASNVKRWAERAGRTEKVEAPEEPKEPSQEGEFAEGEEEDDEVEDPELDVS